MSTLADWQAAYERIRLRYTWLPVAVFIQHDGGRAFFTGIDAGVASFYVPLNIDVNEQVAWHESGHAAHSKAALLRDAAEGRGTAGDDIANEIAAILTGRSWTDPFDPLYKEYVAEAWRKANTGLTGPMGYPNPPGQRDPYPVQELLTYFRTMAEPRNLGEPVEQPKVETPALGTAELTETVSLADHWYSQFGLDSVSSGDCVPASMKSLLSLYYGTAPTIGDIRGVLGVPGGGVDLVTMRAGMSTYGIPGVAVSSQDVPFDDVLGHVREGRPAIVFILYADIPVRVDPFGGIHSVVLVGDNGTVGIVLDPANARDIPARYSLDDMRKAWNDSRTLGGGAFIPDQIGGDMDDARVRQIIQEEVRDTIEAIKAELARQAHHAHTTSDPVTQ